jgi:dTDP-D-glucose 4,6-dehydratase
VTHRRPSIANATRALGWKPVIPLEESVERTLDWFLRDYLERLDALPAEAPAGRAKPAAGAKAAPRKAP